jgi:hypothetical protein
MGGLAVGRELGQHPGALLGLRQRGAAEAESGGGEALQPAEPDLLEAAPPLVDPGRLQPGQERPGGDVVGDACRTPRLRPAPLGDAGLRPVRALQRRLGVDEGRLRQQQLDLCPPPQMVGAQTVPQLRKQHAERVSRLRGSLLPSRPPAARRAAMDEHGAAPDRRTAPAPCGQAGRLRRGCHRCRRRTARRAGSSPWSTRPSGDLGSASLSSGS